MLNWAKKQLANVAGTAEPIYGPSAVRSVAEAAIERPYTDLRRDDLTWQAMSQTSVEAQTFYISSKSGPHGLLQVMYSNVAHIRTVAHFNSKIFYPDGSKPHQWCSTVLSNAEFSDDRASFYADNCALELSADGTTYTIKSMTDARAVVNISISRVAPGFQVGTDGVSLFGENLSNPRGRMRHAFWPRCIAEGTIVTADGPIEFSGLAMYTYALQGMKPHHMAARWNFANFQGPTHSAVMMEFTTPPSYGSTVINVGGIARDTDILFAGATNLAVHTSTESDSDSSWDAPTAARYTWEGITAEGRRASAQIECDFSKRQDRVDVMAEVPDFVKALVASAAGTMPYIYQYIIHASLKLKIGDDDEIAEEGVVLAEATFISKT